MGATLTIATGGMHCIGAWRAKPSGTPCGGVVVIQDIFGIDAVLRRVVDEFAAQGYAAIAPALFDHLETGVELDRNPAGVKYGSALAREVGTDRAVEAVASAAEAIAPAGPIGCVGCGWGGTIALLASIRLGIPAVIRPGAAGTLEVPDEAPRAPLLFHVGGRDGAARRASIERYCAPWPHCEFHVYPGAGDGCDINEAGAALARERTLAFLQRELRGPQRAAAGARR
jgi:carboxymethylenebutenolidase